MTTTAALGAPTAFAATDLPQHAHVHARESDADNNKKGHEPG